MLIDSTAKQLISWRDKLVGHLSKTNCNGSKEKEDFDILEGDIHKSFVNRVPSINFSDRIHQILIRGFTECGNVLDQTSRYGHVKENCTFRVSETNAEKEPTPPEVAPKNHSMVVDGHKEKCENYRPWMLVERKSRRKGNNGSLIGPGSSSKGGVVASSLFGGGPGQQIASVAGSSVGNPAAAEGLSDLCNEASVGNGGDRPHFSLALTQVFDGQWNEVAAVGVGNLDPDRHTAVTFQ
ncbi:hypothetical protein GOBAR_DD17561 [Gossypium barbadense]|nr:hypothetical protein GOBAR_DD17561 [Gossypium barbadense]